MQNTPHIAPDMIQAFTGTLKKSLASGNYFSVTTPERPTTHNETLWSYWDEMNRNAQWFTSQPSTENPMIGKDILLAAFEAIDACFVATKVRFETYANGLFKRTFGKAANLHYEPYAIRWTGNNREALSVSDALIRSIYAIPFLPCNDVDLGLIESQAMACIKPLIAEKRRLIKMHLQIEVKGDLSGDELTALFRKSNILPPISTEITDAADSDADKAAKDKKALEAHTQSGAKKEKLVSALEGVGVYEFKFTKDYQARFTEFKQRSEKIGHTQVPGEPFPFSTTGELKSASASASGDGDGDGE